MNFIDLTSYTNLSLFAILTDGPITSNPDGGNITVNEGYWYGDPDTSTGTLTRGTQPSGLDNGVLASFAYGEYGSFDADLIDLALTLPTSNIGSGEDISTFFPSTDYIGVGITYTDITLTFDGMGDQNSQFFITDTGRGFTFTNVTFNLTNGARPCNIFWSANGTNPGEGAFRITVDRASDSELPGVIVAPDAFTATNNGTGNFNINGHIFSINDPTSGAITLTCTGGGKLNINSTSCGYISPTPPGPTPPGPVVCYAKGTSILTKRGFVPIENIKAGHKVVTKGKIYNNKFVRNDDEVKIEPVMWISKFKVNNLTSKSRPICIKKDALGTNSPFQDLYVSPEHHLLINGKMVQAKNIVDGENIYQDKECNDVEYYHLECENHSAIFANGVWAESYLDVNNRHVFENNIRLQRKVNLKKISYIR